MARVGERTEPMRVTIINRSDSLGGAAVVSRRLMNALRREGVDARMLVVHATSCDPNVTRVNSPTLKLKFTAERLKIFLNNGFDRSKLFLVDDASMGIDVAGHPLVADADILVLGWINQAMLGFKQLKRLMQMGKPVVWIMHDLWNCTAICHHPRHCRQFVDACHDCWQVNGKGRRMLQRATGNKKQLYTYGNLSFVAVSNWVKAACERSALLASKPITVIPNPLDPQNIDYSFRRLEGLPDGKTFVAIGAARLDDPIKGFDTLISLTRFIACEKPELASKLHLLLFGGIKREALLDRLSLPYTRLGYITDPMPIYRSANIVLSTSRHETWGATLAEGIAAGCFAVSTSAGGQADIIDHKVNGYLAGDVKQLADGLEWAAHEATLSRRELHDTMRRFDPSTVARRFVSLFNQLQQTSKL